MNNQCFLIFFEFKSLNGYLISDLKGYLLQNLQDKIAFRTKHIKQSCKMRLAAYNVLTHRGVRAFSALSTTRLAQRLYEENMVSQKEQVEKVISVGVIHNMVTIFGSEEFDLEAKEKTMTCSELAEKIVRNKIHINY